jgi:ABC-type transporter lipoprotein component MlaA
MFSFRAALRSLADFALSELRDDQDQLLRDTAAFWGLESGDRYTATPTYGSALFSYRRYAAGNMRSA